MSSPWPVFVIEGHDIELYPDLASAAAAVEGYDLPHLDFMGADGTVYEAVAEGPEWGRVSLRDSGRNGIADLLRLLRAEATHRSVLLPSDLADEPTAIWDVVLNSQRAQQNQRCGR